MYDDDDDIEFESESFPFDKYLTVKGLLCTHYGIEHGEEIYELLFRTAKEASEDAGDGLQSGIMFNEDGGEFVGLQAE
jgi:hypothetical protein